jgi:hypothetical protein
MKLKEKENLIRKIGMQFDEAIELFSDETLLSMSMVHIVGGKDTNTYCGGAQCVSGCNNNCGCGTSTPAKGTGGESGSSSNGTGSSNNGENSTNTGASN